MESIFYVYEHLTDDGEVFYVGKGSKDRAWRFGRNKLWDRVAKKHGWNVRIVQDEMLEHKAHSLERKLIASHGRRDLGLGSLTNLTDGGEGVSGRSRDEEKLLGTWNKRLKAEGLEVLNIGSEQEGVEFFAHLHCGDDAPAKTLESAYEDGLVGDNMWETLELSHRATSRESEVADRSRGTVSGLDDRGRPLPLKVKRKPGTSKATWRRQIHERIIDDVPAGTGPVASAWVPPKAPYATRDAGNGPLSIVEA